MTDSMLENALRLRRAGKLQEAADVYGEILRSNPRHVEALQGLAVVRYQAGQLEEAERLFGFGLCRGASRRCQLQPRLRCC